MKKTIFKDKYHIWSVEIEKENCSLKNIDEIVNYLKKKIDAHPVAVFISLFDHYKHTQSLKEYKIASNIKNLKNIIFCFGKEIPNEIVGAVRPRSISVCETEKSYIISAMDAPNEILNIVMQDWVKELNPSYELEY